MRKALVFITVLCVVFSLAVSVNAATYAKNVSAYATVANDGSSQITLSATIHLDQAVEDLRFPLPGKSSNVTVNGSHVGSRMENGLRMVNLSGVVGKAVGDITLHFTYSLPNMVVTNEAGLLELQLPLLSGFAYPVQAMEFSVTLPGQVTAKPAFSSGYHQANIEKDLYCTVSGATITGISQVELKDHETLMMTLLVAEEMFPQTRIVLPDFKTVNILTTLFFLLALAYWALFLRNIPTWPFRKPSPPEGFTAGELGSVLHLKGGDLNMMVFSWASLGYLQIRWEQGKVRLYRRMDMGNERSAFEQKCFRQLYGRREFVDAGSPRYGEIYCAVAKSVPNMSSMIHPKSGNLRVFRGLFAVVGMFYGVSLGIGMGSGWFWMIVLGALALVSSWYIQVWAGYLLAADRKKLYLALILCGVWLLLGLLGGMFSVGLNLALSQLFAGLLLALGGRRTPAGRQAMGQTLGFRRYLKTVSREQLRTICESNPDYFHQMMPYAFALGIDRRFARQFGKLSIGPCPYITMANAMPMRADQWRSLMQRILKGMNTRAPNSRVNRLLALIKSFLP